ncbi:MAG: alkaline phosphatase family protein [Proteobacteria bacterium]|nr:alkaline phosphatase family protein [Pseudomonadota bacterium]
MLRLRLAVLAAFSLCSLLPATAKPAKPRHPAPVAAAASAPHNIVIFVADGLRYDSVTPDVAPTLYRIKKEGVDFTNTHAMYPTVTTANASAIASGHYLGDTGDYANTLLFDRPIVCKMNVIVTFLEDDCVLREVKAAFGDGYMGQQTLLMAARAAGYNVAVLGKKGPAAIQNLPALDAKNARVDDPLGVMIDDAINRPNNFDGTPTQGPTLHGMLNAEAFSATGDDRPALTSAPNLAQQGWLTSVAAQALIPDLKDNGKPFVILVWSRDPDATQHSAIDSEGNIVPGINSPTAQTAIANADFQLAAILRALKTNGLADSTDVFVTADHGFSTIAKGIPDGSGMTPPAAMPPGFVALDVADWLGMPIFDIDRANTPLVREDGDRPAGGNAIIGRTADKPAAIVAANGGSDFIYARGDDPEGVAVKIYAGLVKAPYVGSLFVNDALLKGHEKDFPGALPMSAVNLIGSSTVPQPSIVVGFRSFLAKECKLAPLLCAVEIADTGLHTGQGMHGSFSRADTRNFMAAIGPDFKKRFADPAPVSNADIAPTVAHILGITLSGPGTLTGRPATEALAGGKPVPFTAKVLAASPGPAGVRTILEYQEADGRRYFDAAGIPGRIVGLKAK